MRRAALLGLAVALVSGFALYQATRPSIDFKSGSAGPEVVVSVPEGATGAEIATTLKNQGVVKTRQAFLKVVYRDKRANRIQPGGHRLQTRITAATALEQLLDPKRRTGVITFPEGLRASEVIARLKKIGISASLSSVTAPAGYGAKKLEGFLYPGQYAFTPETAGEKALASMVARFIRQTPQLRADSEKLGLTPYQGLIAASLVQAEGDPSDYSKILRVILNRLKIGMALQFDTTVLYALNESGRIRVTSKDLQVNSPYNTYRNRGLPPTPICNPGPLALAALSNPASGNWLYYITVKPGDTRFTNSHDQFLIWKQEFQRNYKAGLFS